jgi:hypothetical protein
LIGDLNETIKQLLVEGVPLNLSEIDVSFEKPDGEWSSSLSRPTINCYLFHVGENQELRLNTWEVGWQSQQTGVQRGEHRVATQRRLPFRLDHFYVVTAWANEIEDEHRLLWRILAALLRYNNTNLPAEKLQGELFGQEWPIPFRVAQQESPIKNPTDLWSSMETPIKPSVNVVATLPLDPDMVVSSPLVITRRARIYPDMHDQERIELPGIEFGGWVWDGEGADASFVAGADVTLVERGITVRTDTRGRFKFDYVPIGSYTLRATADGRLGERKIEAPGEDYDVTLSRSAPSAGKGEPGEPEAPAAPVTGKGRRR